MQHLFVPYETALKLKEKGFKEKCLCVYTDKGKFFKFTIWTNWNKISDRFSAPLYQQVIDWLREEKKIMVWVEPLTGTSYKAVVWNLNSTLTPDKIENNSYYSALQSGIEKAVEFVEVQLPATDETIDGTKIKATE